MNDEDRAAKIRAAALLGVGMPQAQVAKDLSLTPGAVSRISRQIKNDAELKRVFDEARRDSAQDWLAMARLARRAMKKGLRQQLGSVQEKCKTCAATMSPDDGPCPTCAGKGYVLVQKDVDLSKVAIAFREIRSELESAQAAVATKAAATDADIPPEDREAALAALAADEKQRPATAAEMGIAEKLN